MRPSEYPFNACQVDGELERGRPPAYPGEPARGSIVIWTVLGFGGKPYPLVFARCVGFASRAAQALLRPTASGPGFPLVAVGRLQTYVDDPTLSCLGSAEECSGAVDLVVLLWSVLGLPLALPKGSFTVGRHTWIGADFEIRSSLQGWQAVITVPEKKMYRTLGSPRKLCRRQRPRIETRGGPHAG